MPEPNEQPKFVTQEELGRLHQLQEADHQYGELRCDIRGRILLGAPVEPGSFSVTVKTDEERRISQDSLKVLLGEDVAEILINAVPRTVRHKVLVRPCSESHEEAEWEPVFDPELAPVDGRLEEFPRMPVVDLIKLLLDYVTTQAEKPVLCPPDDEDLMLDPPENSDY